MLDTEGRATGFRLLSKDVGFEPGFIVDQLAQRPGLIEPKQEFLTRTHLGQWFGQWGR